ncbi:hypothetical protein EUX98_g9385 [Antrodiella citrinella]|uniref:Helicase C-terminal domain-containing protein n=1 Tax=Antrodiella citrinella TaxID=2447956 RepID=A0A4S4LUF0_9APHY|nr:hypothetical protein EUX98_g9385 [Antrodiella citrinella]
MSKEFKEQQVEKLKKGELWGLCATDSFGMGVDLPDIILVIQWRLRCTLATLWQRLGRGARDRSLVAVAIIFVEGKFFDEERKRAKERLIANVAKRKRKKAEDEAGQKPAKKKRGDRNIPETRSLTTNATSVVQPTSAAPIEDAQVHIPTPLAETADRHVSQPSIEDPPDTDMAWMDEIDWENVDWMSINMDLVERYGQVVDERMEVEEGEEVNHVPMEGIEEPGEARPETLRGGEREGGDGDEENGDGDENSRDIEDARMLEERRAIYKEEPGQNGKGFVWMKKKPTDELEHALDDLVNAATRNFKCRRTPIKVFFNSDKAVSDHLECDPTRPTGCARCCVQSSPTCCDIHNPELATMYLSNVTNKTVTAKRSIIKKVFSKTDLDAELRSDLETWADKTVEVMYGPGALLDLGPGVILPEETLERIVDCSHFSKIHTVEDLKRETKWAGAEEFGAQILSLIEAIYPPAPPPVHEVPMDSATGVPPDAENTSSREHAKKSKQLTCKSCGEAGHTQRAKRCKNYHLRGNNPAPGSNPTYHYCAAHNAAPTPTFRYHHFGSCNSSVECGSLYHTCRPAGWSFKTATDARDNATRLQQLFRPILLVQTSGNSLPPALRRWFTCTSQGELGSHIIKLEDCFQFVRRAVLLRQRRPPTTHLVDPSPACLECSASSGAFGQSRFM